MDKTYWNNRVSTLTPYTPGEQPSVENLIKLNTNENPYPPSPRVFEAIATAADANLRRYPNVESDAVRYSLARYHEVEPENIFVGNGSDEVLAMAFLALFDDGLRYFDITYSFYEVYSALFRIKAEVVPLNADFTAPIEVLYNSKGGAIFPNPNAPTSLLVDAERIKLLCENSPRAVVIDEAYAEFSGLTMIPYTSKYRNLLVIRTLSKSHSLAGMRVGYAVGDASLIAALTSAKNSFNSYPLDRIAQAAAKAAVDDADYMRSTVSKIIETREEEAKLLTGLGFEVLPSGSNFLFVRHNARTAEYIMHELRKRSILVRRFSQPRITNWLRITIGTDEELQSLADALKELL